MLFIVCKVNIQNPGRTSFQTRAMNDIFLDFCRQIKILKHDIIKKKTVSVKSVHL